MRDFIPPDSPLGRWSLEYFMGRKFFKNAKKEGGVWTPVSLTPGEIATNSISGSRERNIELRWRGAAVKGVLESLEGTMYERVGASGWRVRPCLLHLN